MLLITGVGASLACGGLLDVEVYEADAEAPMPLPDGVHRLEALLEPLRAKHDLPALGAAVVHGSELVAIGATGTRASGMDRPVTVHDRWHLGSNTKSMTATLLAHQVKAGRLTWDTPLRDVFPTAHAGWNAVTVADLLHQTARPDDLGLYELFAWRADARAPHEIRRDWVLDTLAAPPDPGAFDYRNAHYVIAGTVLEEVAGTPWEALIVSDLFTPLGMTRSGLGPPRGEHQPWGHAKAFGTLSANPPSIWADNPEALGPAGTAHASLHDWARYAAAHLAIERGDAPWDDPAYRWLHTPAEGETYAAGWILDDGDWADGRLLWHNGSNGSWYALMQLIPSQDRAILVATNVMDPEAIQRVAEAVAAADLAPD
ncbi:MAG: D-alanyl-D-alanine carboxypeptidase [Myxococcota bacterium]|jgi:D-alanyl-D-alanine carboxypeptidase